MSELLPTPTAGDGKAARNRTSGRSNPDSQHHDGVTLTDALRTSASSPASAGWISRWKRTGIPASGRSSGTSPAEESSSDGGRLFPVGEMSQGSALLPTPVVTDAKATRNRTSGRSDPDSKHHDGVTLTDALTSSAEGSPASPPPPPADGREPPTIAGYGRSSPVSLGSWDPELSSWRTSQVSLLSTEDERFPRSSERWPTSGMTRRGRAFALPMSERATAASASSYLPTPSSEQNGDTIETHRARQERSREKHGRPFGDNLNVAVQGAMLHTPTTGDTNPSYDHRISPGQAPRKHGVPNLAAQVDELLPTPRHEGFDAGNHRGQPDSLNQTIRQLPTPKVSDHAGPKRHGDGGPGLRETIQELSSGDPISPPSEGTDA